MRRNTELSGKTENELEKQAEIVITAAGTNSDVLWVSYFLAYTIEKLLQPVVYQMKTIFCWFVFSLLS